MKGSKIKIIAFGIIMLVLLSIIQLPIMANTNTEQESIVLKKADKEFLLYYKNICNSEFEFAFSSNKNEEEENLNFTKSALDQNTDKALNVAYIDETIYDLFFTTSKTAYIWIRNIENKVLVTADLVNLENALDDTMTNLVDTTTKRIEVDTTKTHSTNEIINGVDTTITTGKVVIKEKENASYYYELIKISNENADAKHLFELAEKIQKGTNDTYDSLCLTNEFYDLYTKLIPENTKWTEVTNSEILQPEDTVNGDKYIVWIKEETATDTTIDAKFLTCVYEYEEGRDKTEETIVETVKLPVTFDNGTILFIVLGIIAIALVIIIIAKVRSNRKDENNNEK